MAFSLRRNRFGFIEEGIVAHPPLQSWNEIDESEEWQRGIYFALCAAYAFVSFVALVQLVRIQMRVPEYGWTTQKVFHLMNFVVNLSRAILFGLYKNVFAIKPKALEQVLMEVPGLLFFSTYTLLVLFWAEIYHQARSEPAQKLRPAYFSVNGIVYLIQICLWIYMSVSKTATGMEAAKLFLAVISFCAALGFLLYGGRLFFLLRRFPIESRGRQKKLYEVGSVTSICCTCFLIRCALLAVSAFDEDADLDVLDHPILNLVYYLRMDRTWMYNRANANRHGLKKEFVRGVKKFVKRALKLPICIFEGGIRCPCRKCKCIKISTAINVRLHLYRYGFQLDYWIWTEHGEVNLGVDARGGLNSSKHVHHDNQFDSTNQCCLMLLGRMRMKMSPMRMSCQTKMQNSFTTS